MKMNLPNKLTIFRILMIPVFIVLFFVEFEGHTLAAALVYVVACFTDFFDGYIARKQNLVTNFGKFVDPIADKMIIACSLIAICVTEPIVAPAHVYKILVAVFTMLILSRELMISVFRTVAADDGAVCAVARCGLCSVERACGHSVLLRRVYTAFYRNAVDRYIGRALYREKQVCFGGINEGRVFIGRTADG